MCSPPVQSIFLGGKKLEVFTIAGMIAISKIMLIDILLAGDNAVIIGMAARNLPDALRKKAIFWGTFGAIALRLIMAVLFVEALNTIPALHVIGGLLLLWIGYSLLLKDKKAHDVKAEYNLRAAITTIVIADGVMGIDNVLGVVAAAQGHMPLVIAGMLITVPIIIWGSTVFITLLDRYPFILYIGGGLLGWVAAGMIGEDKLIKPYLLEYHYEFGILCVAFVIGAAVLTNKINARRNKRLISGHVEGVTGNPAIDAKRLADTVQSKENK